MNSLSWKCLAVTALALTVAGCGESGPRLYKAGGTVTYKSLPVEGAEVTFAYDDGEFANGVTDAAGKFQLAYKGKPGGAALGKCKVTVSKVAGLKAAAPAAATTNKVVKSEADFKEQQKAKMESMIKFAADKKEQDASGGAQSLIPKKYADPSTSGFTYDIVADESKNVFALDLKD
jgi:hypothetical protein